MIKRFWGALKRYAVRFIGNPAAVGTLVLALATFWLAYRTQQMSEDSRRALVDTELNSRPALEMSLDAEPPTALLTSDSTTIPARDVSMQCLAIPLNVSRFPVNGGLQPPVAPVPWVGQFSHYKKSLSTCGGYNSKSKGKPRFRAILASICYHAADGRGYRDDWLATSPNGVAFMVDDTSKWEPFLAALHVGLPCNSELTANRAITRGLEIAPGVTSVDLASLVGIVLAIIAVVIASRTLSETHVQTNLNAAQLKIITDELAKRAQLVATFGTVQGVERYQDGGNLYRIECYVLNRGDRGLRDCRLTVYFPPTCEPDLTNTRVTRDRQLSSSTAIVEATQWAGIEVVGGPIYAQDSFSAMSAAVRAHPGTYTLMCQIVSEAGRFPDPGPFQPAQIVLPPLP